MVKDRVKRHHHKVKTGCTTCRLRRVKCDEEKPSCRRCSSAGRKCDGYEDQSQAVISLSWENHPWTHSWTPFVRKVNGKYASQESATIPQILLPPRLLVFDSIEEEQSFDFFTSRSVGELTEMFHIDETFWNLCVLQMSMTQPAVRYAVAAVGALHRKYGSGDTTAIPEDTSDAQTRFGLEQCNRSIKTLVERSGSEGRAEKVSTLVACILYTCLASIQGHQSQSIMHLRNGMRMLDGLDQPKPGERTALTSYSTQFKYFLTTLSSLEAQARSLSCEEELPAWSTRVRLRGVSAPEEVNFATLSEARDFFESILSDFQCYVIERDANKEWLLGAGALPRRSTMEEFNLLVKKHSYGVKALEAFIKQHDDLKKRDEKIIMMLRLHILIVELYFKVYPLSSTHGELAWDRLESYFIKMVGLGRKLLGCTEEDLSTVLHPANEVEPRGFNRVRQTADSKSPLPKVPQVASILKHRRLLHPPVFAFSQGVLGPLSTTAMLCRSPKLRREALALLLLYPRREGLWDSHTAGRVAWTSMSLEEELSREWHAHHGRENFEIKTASDIPSECRIQVNDMKTIGPRTGEIRFSTIKEAEAGEKGKLVKLLEW